MGFGTNQREKISRLGRKNQLREREREREFFWNREERNVRERKKQKKMNKKNIQSYNNHANIHDYCSNFAYIHNYSLSDVGSFLSQCVNLCTFCIIHRLV